MSVPTEPFYAYLSSDADTGGVYPNNGPARFTAPINPPLILDETWEMGLCEIFYPAFWYNVQEPYNSFHVVHNVRNRVTDRTDKIMSELTLPEGRYTPKSLVTMANRLMLEHIPRPFKSSWVYYQTTGRMVFKIVKGEGFRVSNRRLGHMLGFRQPHDTEDKGLRVALPEARPSLKTEYHITRFRGLVKLQPHGPHMYVYTNVTQYSNVGGTMAPLLRAVALEGRPETGSNTIHREYSNIQYYPLRRTHIDSIQVILANAFAEDMPFNGGTTMLVIHFRKKRGFLKTPPVSHTR